LNNSTDYLVRPIPEAELLDRYDFVAAFKLPFRFVYINLPCYPPNTVIRVKLAEIPYYSYGTTDV